MGRGGEGKPQYWVAQETYRQGHSVEGVRIAEVKWRCVPPSGERVAVGVRGEWYDVTKFVEHHPGGDIILEFAGKDATAQFIAYHPDSVLKHWKPVGTYKWDRAAPGGDAFEGAWMRLSEKFEADGLYRTSVAWVLSRFALLSLFFAVAAAAPRVYSSWDLPDAARRACHVLGGVCLAGVWQQSGFLMHDFMHNHIFHKRIVDQVV